MFMDDGKLVDDCNEEVYNQTFSCSNECSQSPCKDAQCSSFDRNDVICFVNGCECKIKWIHAREKSEVNCLTGELVSREAASKRNETCF